MYSIKKLGNTQITDLARICGNSYPAIPLSLEKYAEKMNSQNEFT